jgi:hypothetical protein
MVDLAAFDKGSHRLQVSQEIRHTYNVGFLTRWDLPQELVREPNSNYEYQQQIA